MRISDWSSDVCSSDLVHEMREAAVARAGFGFGKGDVEVDVDAVVARAGAQEDDDLVRHGLAAAPVDQQVGGRARASVDQRIARDDLFAFELDEIGRAWRMARV